MMEHAVLSLAGIVLAGIACQWLAWWAKLPAILFLLLTGLLVGPGLGWLMPDALFGDLLFPAVSLAVSVVLFEGSMSLRLREIRGLERVVRNMVSHGLIVTWVVIALATRWLLGLDWELALLFGALVVVTGPTVVIPMLRTVRPKQHIADVLRWEGIVIDPIGALLAVLVYEFILARASGGGALVHTAGIFGTVIFTGLIVGAAFGEALARLLRSHAVPDYLRSVTALALVFAAFAGANALQSESGLMAVTVMGMWVGNRKHVPLEDILHFKESLSVLLISVLFIVLAARVDFAALRELGLGALGILLVAQFIARPLKVLLCTWGSSFDWREKALLSWLAPRGIVAAAVSAIFAPRLAEAGFAQASYLVPLTFVIIVGTVLLQGLTAGPLARWLGVAEPEPRGVLIVGANIVARAVAKALTGAGFRVVLADASWDHSAQARLDGLEAFYGNPVSEQGDRRLDLVGIGRMLALTPRHEVNTLAALRFRGEFGRNAVYRLSGSAEKGMPAISGGRVLFDMDATFQRLAAMLGKGGELRGTLLSEAFGWQDYLETNPDSVLMFTLDRRQVLRFFVAGEKLEPQEGWRVFALHPPAEAQAAAGGQ